MTLRACPGVRWLLDDEGALERLVDYIESIQSVDEGLTKNPREKESQMNTLGKARSIELLRRAADSVPQLMALHGESQEFRRWLRNTEVVIRNVFGNDSNQDSEFKRILFSPPGLFLHTSDQEFKKAYY